MASQDDFQKDLEQAQKEITNIKISDDQPPDPPELNPIKEKLSLETAKILAPVLYKFVEDKAMEIAQRLAADAVAPLIERIAVLEAQLNGGS
jgi:hypothetical protein